MQRGDQIIAIDGNGLGQPTDFDTLLNSFLTVQQGLREGQRVEIGFLRDSDLARETPEQCAPVTRSPDPCEVAYRLTPFPDADFVALFVVPYISGIIVLIIGVIVFALRPNQPGPRTVVGAMMALSVFMTGLFDLNTSYRLIALWIFASVMLGGVLISLAFIFPTRSAMAYRQPLLRFLPIIITFFIGAALAYVNANPITASAVAATQLGAVALNVVGLVILVIALLVRRVRATTALARDQINTLLIGIMLTVAIAAIWAINVIANLISGADAIAFNTSAAVPFFIIPALSMAYAVLQYRSYNTDRIISAGITYTIMLIGLVIGYTLLVFGASLITQSMVGADNPVLIAVVIFVMAIIFVPVRSYIQKRVDRLYFRNRTNYQQEVEDFSRTLTSASTIDEIAAQFRAALDTGLQPEQILIFVLDREAGEYVSIGTPSTDLRFSASSPMIEMLRTGTSPLIYLEAGKPWDTALVVERSRLQILKTLVLIGFRGANQLNGFAILSAPRSGAGRYGYEELRYIENLTAQTSIGVERAQVIVSLERRVRELDVIGQVSQAVSYTLEFEDLLELIATQADKVVEASHLYIVLSDPTTNELYYAFFLEKDERYPDKENRRWARGDDLYTEVLRNGQPVRVNNFVRALSERGVTDFNENPELKAFIAVPLVAGVTRIGVIAAGNTQSNKSYSDEQVKLFNDIAALAATSIEKARLFSETNARARQLSVLNDISRQIVASEANLEELLKLITGAATDILTSEAGSLLLTSDDGTGDLVFRVAVGGSGTDIVGVRVPAKKGLVGEVAMSGQPVIVSDVASDSRWGGELGKGAFQTRSVIAVPLISQGGVIGVLEVLNKRVGTFTGEDADLLNTFAGQAAVAIENARLFQQTDQQLSLRVSELETLEQIDVELNRSLDLTKVARITVEWAMQNSSASAVLLGVVVGEPPRLEIVYSQGYEDADKPDSADGRLYPLDRGIVSRIMRTKQAELVPDVKFDRDYIPSLRGGMSQITIPMLSGGVVNAMLVLETNHEPRLRLADLPFLQRLAEHASIAITNAQLYAELSRANQSKSEFVSFVAHELKNPLTSIRGYSDFLLGGQTGQMSDMQVNFVNTIRNNAERMNTLVSDLNDVTKLQTNNLRIDARPVEFKRVVEETLRPLQKQIDDKRQRLVLDVPDDLPPMSADEGRLIQVLTNLVSNAYKYSPEEGTITIHAHVETSPIDEKGRSLLPQLVASVTDTGIGMSPEDLAKLFTPYFRSENPLAQAQPGTGLGMAITRGIVEQHGGDITVRSELGSGSTFTFTVPLAIALQAGD